MPDFAAHRLFGEHLELPAAAKKHWNVFCWGLQGPDILFYRRVVTGKSPYHKLGNRMHDEGTRQLFEAMTAYCRQAQGDYRDCAQAYLYGFAGHYALDSTVHPYVFYHQHQRVAAAPQLSPGGVHCAIESDIDSDLYSYLRGEPVTSFTPGEGCALTEAEGQTLGALYTYLLYDVYRALIPPKEVAAAIRDTTGVQRLLYGGGGPVLGVAAALDKLLNQQGVFTGHFKGRQPQWDSLNLGGNQWENPWTGEKSCESVPQLMDRAAESYGALVSLLERNAAGALLPLPITLNFAGKPIEA